MKNTDQLWLFFVSLIPVITCSKYYRNSAQGFRCFTLPILDGFFLYR